MTILTPTSAGDTVRTLSLFTREGDIEEIYITDEQTSVEFYANITSITTINGKATEITISFEEDQLIAGHYYSIKVYNEYSNIIYRGKILVSGGEQPEYTQYTATDNTNEYIILD